MRLSNIHAAATALIHSAHRCRPLAVSPYPCYAFQKRPFSKSGRQRLYMNNKIPIHFLDSVESTQDEARQIIIQQNNNRSKQTTDETEKTKRSFVVSASNQTKGRGTSGRSWIGHDGNVFLTIAIPVSQVSFPITLMPLKVGSIVARHIHQLLVGAQNNNNDATVTLKWPNDVLINEEKVAGILIESQEDWLLVGVGINVAFAPPIDSTGPQHGRSATCLQRYCELEEETNRQLVEQIAQDLSDFLESLTHRENVAKSIIKEWEHWANLNGKQMLLRDSTTIKEYALVVPLGIEADGRLRVRNVWDGKERLLCTDYLL